MLSPPHIPPQPGETANLFAGHAQWTQDHYGSIEETWVVVVVPKALCMSAIPVRHSVSRNFHLQEILALTTPPLSSHKAVQGKPASFPILCIICFLGSSQSSMHFWYSCNFRAYICPCPPFHFNWCSDIDTSNLLRPATSVQSCKVGRRRGVFVC